MSRHKLSPMWCHTQAPSVQILILCLWLGGEASGDQGFISAENSFNPLVTIFQHDERRTGARVFSRSGTVINVPCVFIHGTKPGLNFAERQTNAAKGMTGCILVG